MISSSFPFSNLSTSVSSQDLFLIVVEQASHLIYLFNAELQTLPNPAFEEDKKLISAIILHPIKTINDHGFGESQKIIYLITVSRQLEGITQEYKKNIKEKNKPYHMSSTFEFSQYLKREYINLISAKMDIINNSLTPMLEKNDLERRLQSTPLILGNPSQHKI